MLAQFGNASINYGNMHPGELPTHGDFDPKDIRSRVNGWVKKNEKLPTQIKPSELLQAARENGGSQYHLWAAQEYARLKGQTLNNVIGLEQAAVSYAQTMMAGDRRLQELRIKHGTNEIQHGVGTGMSQAEYGAYRSQAQGGHWTF